MSGPAAPRETGSWFPLDSSVGEGEAAEGIPPSAELFGNGRQALVALVRHGRSNYGWSQLLVPSYYCPEVLSALSKEISLTSYPVDPLGHTDFPQPRAGQAVLSVAFFGRRPPEGLEVGGEHSVLDATHDPVAPWLPNARAGFVYASLRKTLPLPDGGALWSPLGLPVPAAGPAVDGGHAQAVALMLAAMSLKREYLEGANPDKATYLDMHAEAERSLGSEPVGISRASRDILRGCRPVIWRRQRLKNAQELGALLEALPSVRVHVPPYGVVLRFEDPSLRDRVRDRLIQASIYPAVLWNLLEGEAGAADVDFSSRMLFLHTDHRWDRTDMHHVAATIRSICGGL